MDNKYYELSTELHSKIDDLGKELKGRTEERTEEVQKQLRLLGKELKGKMEEGEDAVMRLRMEVRAVQRQLEEQEQNLVYQSFKPDSPPPLPPLFKDDPPPIDTLPSTDRSPVPAYLQAPSSPDTILSDLKLSQLEARIKALERRVSTAPPTSKGSNGTQQVLLPNYLTPSEILETKLKVDLMHEIEARNQTMEKEIEELRRTFLESLRINRADSMPDVQPFPLPSSELKDIHHRLTRLEASAHPRGPETLTKKPSFYESPGPLEDSAVSLRHRDTEVATPSPVQRGEGGEGVKEETGGGVGKDELESLDRGIREEMAKFQAQIYILNESVRNFSPNAHFVPMLEDIERLKILSTHISEEVQHLATELDQFREDGTQGKDSSSNASITYRLSALLVATKSLAMGAPQKLITDIRANARSMTHHPTTIPYTAHLELLQGFEVQLNGMRHDLDKLKLEMSSRDRELDEVNQHFERLENLFQGSLERIQIEMNQKMEGVMELLDRPADHPDATKNLTALRGVILKLQKEIRDLALSNQKPLASDTPLENPSPSKTAFTHIHKLEGQMKGLEVRFVQVSADLESMQQWIKRSAESQGAARLAEMESFRSEIETVLSKVMDGVKLNKRDFENLSELYEKLDLKGDKSELAQKVDKGELRKAYAKLQARIDSFREEVKRLAEPSPPAVLEEAAASTRRLETGCLSCGQGVPSMETERDWKHATAQFPSRSSMGKFGHGFSKLLPMLEGIVSPKGKSGEGARGSKTERAKFQRTRFPESYSSFSSAVLHSPSCSSHL